MTEIVILFVALWLLWAYIKPAVSNLGKAMEHSSEAIAKGAIKLNAQMGEGLEDELLAKLEAQRKFLK